MTTSNSEQLNTSDEKSRLAFRRLLLAKELYQHGLEHANQAGALNQMISIHNFHNAIEIALKAIFLHHEIRAERELNIDFESMLNEVDRHQHFRDTGRRLPYRQELRNLNQIRNLAQHHAIEPAPSVMDEWKVFSRRFLERICKTYFNLDFDSLSELDMIEDPQLRTVLQFSLKHLQDGDLAKSVVLTKLAFEWASRSILGFLPHQSSYAPPFLMHDLRGNRTLYNAFRATFEGLEQSNKNTQYFAAMLASGVSLAELRRFEVSTPSITFSNTKLFGQMGRDKLDASMVRWVHDFVVTTTVRWQLQGLSPQVPVHQKANAEKMLTEIENGSSEWAPNSQRATLDDSTAEPLNGGNPPVPPADVQ